MPNPQIYAHRGARCNAPENTIPAFETALDMGIDGVELDVQCSSDGQLVVIHDFSVDKTTSGSGPVEKFTAAELAALDAGSHFSAEYAGVGVPTLEQVLEVLQGRCQLNIEIKSMDRDGGRAVDLVAKLVQERNLYDQVLISSFNPITLIKMRWVDPKVPIGLLYEKALPAHLESAWLSPIIAPQALHPYYPIIDAELVDWGHSNGYAVNTWTVNEVDDARRLADLGIDVLMSDVPDLLMAALRS